MKKFLLALFAVLLMASPASAVLDFTEGQMIPTTLKNGYTFSAQQTLTLGAIGATPAAQTIGSGGTIAADACGGWKEISAAGAVTTDTTNTLTAPGATNKGCCMTLYNSSANTITLDGNTLCVLVGGAGTLAVTQLDVVNVCSDGTTWRQTTALLSLN